MLQPIMNTPIGREQHRGDGALFAGPVKENLLVLLRQVIRRVRFLNILVHTTRRVAK